jgi:hypothetical protein
MNGNCDLDNNFGESEGAEVVLEASANPISEDQKVEMMIEPPRLC